MERLGLGVAAQLPVQLGQVVKALADIRVVGSECLFTDREPAFGEGLSLLVPSLHPVQLG